MSDIDISRLRQEYSAAGLTQAAAGTDPIALFDGWMSEAIAAGVHEPNAMALATATPDGRPSVRIVLLKGFTADGARFYTNYESRKADELEHNPYASVAMLWHELERQVRIEGRVQRLDTAESDAYFASRPPGSRLGAIASPQSRVVRDRAELEARYSETQAHYGEDAVRPDHWGGYLLRPDVIEFWQGRRSRMHDRIRFVREGDSWRRERLAP